MKAALFALALFATAHAAENPAAGWRVRAELLVIRVPQQAGIALASRWADLEKCQTAFAEAQEVLTSGKATLVADAIADGAGGQQVTNGLMEEVRFSTELSPLDERLRFAPKDGSKTLAPSTTGFAARQSGVAFECSSEVAHDGRSLLIRGSVRNCWLERMRRFEHALLKDGTKLFFAQPIFHAANDYFTAHLRSGETALVGTHVLAHPAATMELRLLTAHTRARMARAQDRIPEDARGDALSWRVCMELQKIVVSESLALTLRDDAVDGARAEAVLQRLVSEKAKGKCELRASSFLHTLSGERTVCETISDQPYEGEMQPHGPGQQIVLGRPFLSDGISLPFAFEHRQVGVRTEAEPKVSMDGRTIELSLTSETIGMHGFTRWAANADTRGTQGFLYLPSFSNTRIATTLTLESGVRRCIGFQKVPGGGGKIELTFLKATTTPIRR